MSQTPRQPDLGQAPEPVEAPHPVPPNPRHAQMDELSAAKAALLAEAAAPPGPSAADKAIAIARERPYILLAAAVGVGAILGFNKGSRRILALGAAFGAKNILARVVASKLR